MSLPHAPVPSPQKNFFVYWVNFICRCGCQWISTLCVGAPVSILSGFARVIGGVLASLIAGAGNLIWNVVGACVGIVAEVGNALQHLIAGPLAYVAGLLWKGHEHGKTKKQAIETQLSPYQFHKSYERYANAALFGGKPWDKQTVMRDTLQFFLVGKWPATGFSSFSDVFDAYLGRVYRDGKIAYYIARIILAFAGGFFVGVVLTPLHAVFTVIGGFVGGVREYGLGLTTLLNCSFNAGLHTVTYCVRSAFANATDVYDDVIKAPRYTGPSLFQSDVENVMHVTWRKEKGATWRHLLGSEKHRSFPLSDPTNAAPYRIKPEPQITPPLPTQTHLDSKSSPPSSLSTPDRQQPLRSGPNPLSVKSSYAYSDAPPYLQAPYDPNQHMQPMRFSSTPSAHYHSVSSTQKYQQVTSEFKQGIALHGNLNREQIQQRQTAANSVPEQKKQKRHQRDGSK